MAASGITGAHGRDITAAELAWSAPLANPPLSSITFHDVLTALNPLQFLPVVGSIYRVATGDEGSPTLRTAASVIGGALMGGPVGVLTSIAGQLAEHFFHFEHLARAIVAPPSDPPAVRQLAVPSARAAVLQPAALRPAAAPPAASLPAAVAAGRRSAAAQDAVHQPVPPNPGLLATQATAAYDRVGDLPTRIVWGGRER